MTAYTYSQSVTLDASGSGSVRFAPSGWNWTVNRVTVKASTAVLESVASTYRQLIADHCRIGTSVTGSTGDSDTELHEFLTDGTPLYVQWTGGDVGALATATIQVEQERVR